VARHRLDEPYEQRFGGRFYGLHRKDLQRALLDAVGDGVVHTGHRCVDVVETGGRARIVMENGHTDDADVVVAADGVHSALRRTVSDGGAPVFSGAVGYRGTIPIEQLPALPDPLAVQFWMGPGRHLLHYPIDAGAVVNFLAVVRTPRWTAERWMEQCDPADAVGAYAGWHPAVTEMVGAAPEGARWALFERRPLKRWSRGRVVLVGDSAHAMLPHQGQGAGQTVEDAVALADCLAAAGPGRHTEAFARYEAVRLRRTRRVQAASRRAFDLLHLPAGPEADARDAELPRLDDALTWIHAHDVRGAGVPVA
jgi:salicylate hydroxylase